MGSVSPWLFKLIVADQNIKGKQTRGQGDTREVPVMRGAPSLQPEAWTKCWQDLPTEILCVLVYRVETMGIKILTSQGCCEDEMQSCME